MNHDIGQHLISQQSPVCHLPSHLLPGLPCFLLPLAAVGSLLFPERRPHLPRDSSMAVPLPTMLPKTLTWHLPTLF